VPDHIGLSTTAASTAVLTGDPARVQWFAEAWGGTPVSSGDRRGYHYVELADTVIMSTGIGSPALAIAVEELADLGIERFIRVGTCGGLGPVVSPGDLVLPAAAVADDGTSQTYLPERVPAIPDFRLHAAIVDEARSTSLAWRVGIVHSKDPYYSEKPERTADPAATRTRWDTLRAVGVLATDMETAALFAVGLVRRLGTAAVLVNVGADPDKRYLRPGLEAALRLARGAFCKTADEPERAAR
jgi:uridine phosphorylase